MKKKYFVAVLFLGALLASCVPSIYPLYTEKDIIFDPALLGTWVGENQEQIWEFSTEDSFSYNLVYTDDSVASGFTVHLVFLEGNLFMDLYPDELEFGNELYQMYLIPAHTIAKAFLENDLLRLDWLDIEWLEEMIETNTLKISHEKLENNTILLTAKTKDLQAMVMKYGNDEKAFAKGDELYKQE